ncbi:histidinol dehydrogenase [Shewanella sp. NIFS-20-20]|uniref:histidinol dehydrogenase n=1 Tax=Shewanella sp. NIFS-20-20 TaxID=2853806 RepID=UPI001C4622CB|nr:histidinol dehydrogenase [Shewanella sp. NIFS-20-20]MBV7314402.1 histidinol dehydrogenase [Shewanella sp. NIFS-20-20]
MQVIQWHNLSPAEQRQCLQRAPQIGSADVSASVRHIIEQVIDNGDEALAKFNREFDHTQVPLAVPSQVWQQAGDNLSDKLKQSIEYAITNIKRFHRAQQPAPLCVSTRPGVSCELKSHAIDSVGLYVPGGSAPLVSTVMMLAIPAAIAGCRRRVLVSPAPINDAIIYAAKLCDITEIYQVGGAQAIAALAFGTETIAAVDKIFGPGNSYVTEAKQQVAQSQRVSVSIDMPAGPSEVLILADELANPDFIAADLLSQAEHGSDSQVLLVSDSLALLRKVKEALARQLPQLSRQNIARQALSHSRLIVCDSMAQACDISNRYGPEHLIIQTQDNEAVLAQVRNAGSIFVGAYTPESVGDYASGTNHVLPTYGYSRSVSSLSLADFSRRYTVQTASAEGLQDLAPAVMALANAELLDGHANAIAVRLKELAND